MEMQDLEATAYRRSAARLSCLARDRPESAFSANTLARHMAHPKVGDEVRMKVRAPANVVTIRIAFPTRALGRWKNNLSPLPLSFPRRGRTGGIHLFPPPLPPASLPPGLGGGINLFSLLSSSFPLGREGEGARRGGIHALQQHGRQLCVRGNYSHFVYLVVF